MATFKRFEDIQAWQKARRVTRKIYELTAEGRFSKDYGLRDQSQRAGVSIMANIAEGFGRHSDKEFAKMNRSQTRDSRLQTLRLLGRPGQKRVPSGRHAGNRYE